MSIDLNSISICGIGVGIILLAITSIKGTKHARELEKKILECKSDFTWDSSRYHTAIDSVSAMYARMYLIEQRLKAKEAGYSVPTEIPYNERRDARVLLELRRKDYSKRRNSHLPDDSLIPNDIFEGHWQLDCIPMSFDRALYNFCTKRGSTLDFEIEIKFEEFRCNPNYKGY